MVVARRMQSHFASADVLLIGTFWECDLQVGFGRWLALA